MTTVHATAIIEPGAQLAQTVRVDAYAIVRANVQIGEGSSVGAHCVIEGHTRIGRENRIFPFCSIGAAPQDKKYAGEPTELHIGDRNNKKETVGLLIIKGTGGLTRRDLSVANVAYESRKAFRAWGSGSVDAAKLRFKACLEAATENE